MFGNYLVETAATTYPSDASDAERALIRPFMPRNKPNGSDMTTSMRDVVNAIFYQNRTGCQWRYYRWLRDGTWGRVLDALRSQERQRQGRSFDPKAKP